MPNFSGVYSGVPGDRIIFRGGDTWHFGNSSASPYAGGSWAWSTNGNSTHEVYLGVDPSWYSGSVWTRPIFTGDNSTSTSLVASCSYPGANNFDILNIGSNAYVQVDDFEFTGICIATAPTTNLAYIRHTGTHQTITNNYFHGWSMKNCTGCDALNAVFGPTGISTSFNVVAGNVFDGSDSFCSVMTGTPGSVTGTCSGTAWYGDGYDFHQNTVRWVSIGIDGNDLHLIHDNTIEYLYESFDTSVHSDIIESASGNVNGQSVAIYNNRIRHTDVGSGVWPESVNAPTLIFNNVQYDNGNSGNCYMLNGQGSSGPAITVSFYHNTSDAPCTVRFLSQSPQFNGTANFENNHWIGYSPQAMTSVYSIDSGALSKTTIACPATGNCATDTTEVFQSEAAANAQGYVPANDYAPTSALGATIAAGTNLYSSCSTFSADLALCSGTSSGVKEVSGSGGYVASYPAIPLVPRAQFGAWDAEAYWYPITSGSSTWGCLSGCLSGSFSVGIRGNPTPAGPVTYLSYTGQNLVAPPATPNFGALTKTNGQFAFDTSYPSGTPAKLFRCTDANIAPGHTNVGFSAGLGGSGDAIMFDSSTSMMHLNITTGATAITLFNASTGICGDPVTGHVITRDKNLTVSGGSSSSTYGFGGGAFSMYTPGLWIAGGTTTDVSSSTQITAYSISPVNGTFTFAPIADMKYGLPFGVNAPAWKPNTPYTLGAYVSYTLTSAQYKTWAALTSTFQLGDIIVPVTGCALKLFTAGTTGGAPPSWNNACSPLSTNTVKDGSAVWKGLNTGPTFVFELTSGSGLSGSSTPAFVPASGHPDLLTAVPDGTLLTWTNVGLNGPPTWQSFGGSGISDSLISEGFSNNGYGVGGNYTGYNSDQGTGIHAVVYDRNLNIYHLFNTLTNFFTDYTCVGGTGYNCAGGAFTATTLGQATDLNGCNGFIHNVKGAYGNFVMIAPQGSLGGDCTAGGTGTGFRIWTPQQIFNAATQIQLLPFQPNHWFLSNNYLGAFAPAGWGYSTGVYATYTPLAAPVDLPPANWAVFPCVAAGGGSTASEPSCNPGVLDSHLEPPYNSNGVDNYPMMGTIYNVSTISPVPVQAWDGEEIAATTSPTNPSPGSSAVGTIYRFTHDFCMGSNPQFDAQFCISQVSQDQNWIAFTSDWMGTLGATTGSPPTVCTGACPVSGQLVIPAVPSNPSCVGGPVWIAGATYVAGNLVGPIGSTSGSGAVYDVYQVITGGTSAANPPNWKTSTGVGQVFTDANGVVYQDIGPGNCRSDVMLAQLPHL